MAAIEALINAPEFTVSELSSALKRTVEDNFGHVRVRGEISGFRGPHSSGHCYFALKDESAKIEAVIWKCAHCRMRFKPQEGLEVIATGKLTTYPGSSKYQIVIEALEPAGIGALMALMEERKKKLAAEGLFDEARKQLLPWLPEVIGVVTSPTGAVIRDILHRLEDRRSVRRSGASPKPSGFENSPASMLDRNREGPILAQRIEEIGDGRVDIRRMKHEWWVRACASRLLMRGATRLGATPA